jgi:hypothetical protein
MERSLLAEIIRDAVMTSVVTTVSRHAQLAAEQLTETMLQDPATRASLVILVREAFEHAVEALKAPRPQDSAV